MSSNAKIGFLDSGIGGVTVLRETVKLLPNEDYVFFSDSINNPYGDKSDEEIIARCDEIVNLLVNKKGCKAVVVACNTASAKAVKALREKYTDIPIVAIEPAYKMVHDNNPDGFTLIMATKGTAGSEKFRRLYYSYYNHKTSLLACVGLADLIEQDKKDELDKYLEEHLSAYRGKAQNVVLGCTHYPLVKKNISNILGNVQFFDGSQGVSKRLKFILEEKNLLTESRGGFTVDFIDSSADKKQQEQKKERFFKLLEQEN
ncbi:MAG: glutamate racemase [Acetobacter sp.]|nr:glutamate racemase [Bacteroides sp.]MCM1340352.1 glutamate racemase [Acetobacter sp.]MCM1433001.1 glutamate racemase [Clostridiales bacterium]